MGTRFATPNVVEFDLLLFFCVVYAMRFTMHKGQALVYFTLLCSVAEHVHFHSFLSQSGFFLVNQSNPTSTTVTLLLGTFELLYLL